MKMLWAMKKRYVKRFTFTALKIFAVAFVAIFIIFPLIFKFSYKLQEKVIFSNFINIPINPNYSNPSKYGIQGTRNFYIEGDDNIKLGVWHILPENLSHIDNDAPLDVIMNSGYNFVIYNHGNSGHRVEPFRIGLYKILRKFFHVIAFDYRGYGDSTNVSPTEIGVVRDSFIVYQWVANRTSSRIFIWGHSLGTAISTHMVSLLGTFSIRPAGLILESPFTNMREEITEYPLSQPFRYLPWFHSTIMEPMQSNNFIFATDRHILNVDCPILILHAEDDGIVPFELGYKLYEEALKYRKPNQGSVEFVSFSSMHEYGHKRIFRAPELSYIIKHFVIKSLKENEQKNL